MLETLDERIRGLKDKNAALAARNRDLEAENADLKRRIQETERERDNARLDAEFLTVSHKLADSPDSLIATRRHIAKLIRNIDRCLDMLKE